MGGKAEKSSSQGCEGTQALATDVTNLLVSAPLPLSQRLKLWLPHRWEAKGQVRGVTGWRGSARHMVWQAAAQGLDRHLEKPPVRQGHPRVLQPA